PPEVTAADPEASSNVRARSDVLIESQTRHHFRAVGSDRLAEVGLGVGVGHAGAEVEVDGHLGHLLALVAQPEHATPEVPHGRVAPCRRNGMAASRRADTAERSLTFRASVGTSRVTITSEQAESAAGSVENVMRLRAFTNSSSRPGSWTGNRPAPSCVTSAGSKSTAIAGPMDEAQPMLDTIPR